MTQTDRSRERALSSERRAGSWLRRRAVEQQYRFLRENPRIVVVLLGVYFALLPLAWFQPDWLRQAFIGALTAAIVWLGVLLTWQLSGVAHLQQGELAERWTVQQLLPLAKAGGWHLINHVLFRPWDIDHILIGPAGVIVIETKGGNSDWSEPRHEQRIRDAARQASDNAGDARRFVRPDIGGAPVHAVVALWPANQEFQTRAMGEVTVLSGHRLCEWVSSLPADGLGSDGALAAWRRIADHLDRRDAYDIEKHGRAPRTLEQLTFDLVQYPLGVLLGASVSPVALKLPSPVGFLAVLGTAGLAVLAARRWRRFRRIFTGVVLGVAMVVVALAVIVGSHYLG